MLPILGRISAKRVKLRILAIICLRNNRQDSQADVIIFSYFFFFQAEDGIRDLTVTGVQTCALPISRWVVSTKAFSAMSAMARDSRRLPVSATTSGRLRRKKSATIGTKTKLLSS